MKNQNKSPLKDRPLRIPGQSLDDEMQKIMDGELVSNLLLPILLILFSVSDWLLWYQVIKTTKSNTNFSSCNWCFLLLFL